jgi:hypothetical protein
MKRSRRIREHHQAVVLVVVIIRIDFKKAFIAPERLPFWLYLVEGI